MRRIGAELIVSTAAGLVFLGIGGRLVMRAVALGTGRAPELSGLGSLNVILLGAGVGLIGGIMHLILVKFLPTRLVLREAIFGVLLSLLTTRGLKGQFSIPATLFFVLAGLYGLTVVILSRRIRQRASLESRQEPT